MSDQKLKPCPFCKSIGANIIGYDGHFYVACGSGDCFAALGEIWDRDAMPDHEFTTREEAAAAWNTRANDGKVLFNIDAAHDMIRCLLPLAKGYVHAHSGIRSTECIIEDAEAILRQFKEK